MVMELPHSLKSSLESTKVQYKQLGSSGLRVSVPILGCLSFGDPKILPWVIGEEEALPILKAAYERGLNTWDTANAYSSSRSETIIGKALKLYGIPRQKVVLLTKCGFPVPDDDDPGYLMASKSMEQSKDYQNQFGLSRAAILNQVDASLKRLGTSYIDVLQIHRLDSVTPFEETMKALDDLVRGGKVRYIGASSMWATQFAQMQFIAEKHGWTKFVSMQNCYSLLYREEEREMNRFCTETGVGLIPWGTLCNGALAKPPGEPTARRDFETKYMPLLPGRGENDLAVIKRVEEIADKRGLSMVHIALAWITPKVSSPIVGLRSLQQLDQGIAACQITLTDEERVYLEELYQPKVIYGHR
ncbi:Versiconal hemiacetal acetate reductase 4 [Colletotrichum chlorophyti]|uniref:Versiconal hemiacetal acetate reductase 4 n=1 Tax=Colletotrichum chlorophyti TaxID=708187 RepID=A0A1Q8RX02_9PEZI|nr:Versiconal hemiacetal acetate reductase 4 [Colletotrichum chlorophyti]